jgi:dolichol-phosphate mannosyltransferase
MTGIKAAKASVIATLDGDGQNDPADIPALYSALKESPDRDRLLVAGLRAKRQDTWIKRASSKVANKVRGGLLGDNTPDAGCGLKVFTQAAFLDMPHFDHMHRFLPALMIRRGGAVISLKVNHRPRERGASKYGTLDRLAVGIIDLLGMLWLQRRVSTAEGEELTSKGKTPKAASE